MSARAAVTAMPDGQADAAALEALELGYDTKHMLDAVGTLDEVRTRHYDPEGPRDDLLRRHRTDHTLVNGAGLTDRRRPEGALRRSGVRRHRPDRPIRCESAGD